MHNVNMNELIAIIENTENTIIIIYTHLFKFFWFELENN